MDMYPLPNIQALHPTPTNGVCLAIAYHSPVQRFVNVSGIAISVKASLRPGLVSDWFGGVKEMKAMKIDTGLWISTSCRKV
jgi:hypothetical protein